MDTRVRLDIFEGPLDLLLHLIKKNEVSIAEIPIATITEQYLATLDLMETLNLDVAGEFLVMAATLIHIKSRMLLPPEAEEAEEEEEDPRAELVRRLLEYQKFKQAAQELERRDVLNRDVFARPAEPGEDRDAVEFDSLSVFDLLSVLREVLEKLPEEELHEITLERISVREKMNELLDRLHRSGRRLFQELCQELTSRIEVIVTFLAVLELVKMRAIRVWQEKADEPIVIELAAPLGEVRGRMETEGEKRGA